MKTFFSESSDEVLKYFHVTSDGLSGSEVEQRQKEHGMNSLYEKKKKGLVTVFFEQFKDLLVGILIVAAVISMLSGEIKSTIVIFAVIILNAILGTVQHFKAEKSLDSLKALSSPSAKVIRNGAKVEIPSKEVVPGDILLLEAGDLVAADGRIINNYSLQVNESSLTGESENVDKTDSILKDLELPLGDRINMVFSGSLVTYGRAVVIVTATGMDTEIGKIAELMNRTEEKKTPLQTSLDDFSKKLAFMIIGISILVFLLGLYRKMPVLNSLMFAVALAVAAIPEALSSIVTIVLALGTQKMVKEHAIMKELKAVESLGCVSVICSDKTGTLTQNKMTVRQIFIDNKVINSSELDLTNPLHLNLMQAAILPNDAAFADGKPIGDPTEFALLELSHNYSLKEEEWRGEYKRLAEIPFDSDRKLMSTMHKINGKTVMLTKGAFDVLTDRTVSVQTQDGIHPITEQDRKSISDANEKLSSQGLRVLSFAYKILPDTQTSISPEDENDFIFLGLISMIDPPRAESKQAVENAKSAGIRTVMITGDHKVTAVAIAKQIGIFGEDDLAITGSDLDKMSEEDLKRNVEHISVYARVSPEHKIRIVNAWQSLGKIVSMTGDGVNDAPALKKADIGVAMGITGTEVSKDAASMILTDDNFSTIIKAIKNGRNVFNNIKNSIRFLLSGNMAGILSVLYTSLLGLPIPFAPVHLLFINLLTDSLPAIAIGMEQSTDDLLKQKPRDPKKSILDKKFLLKILVEGGLIGAFTMASYHIGLKDSPFLAMTMAFCTLTLARLFHGFNCRNAKSLFQIGLFCNPYSLLAFFGGILLVSAVLFIPALRSLFSVSVLTAEQIGTIFLLSILPTILIQIYKVLFADRN